MDNMKLSCTAAAKIDEICEEHGNDAGEPINILHETQKTFGYLPHEVQVLVAKKLGIPVNRVNGVVSFYTFFTEKPKGKHIVSVCLGTACYVKGAPAIVEKLKEELGIDVGETSQDGLFTLQVARCLGTCGLAPVLTINEDVHASVKPDLIPAILEKYRKAAAT